MEIDKKVITEEPKIAHAIPRKPYGFTKQDLIDHIKCIGQTIVDDAEEIAPDPSVSNRVIISAIISPGDKVTTIHYAVRKTADPRLKAGTEGKR